MYIVTLGKYAYKLQKNAKNYQFLLATTHIRVIIDLVAVTVQYIYAHYTITINDPEHLVLTEPQRISELRSLR